MTEEIQSTPEVKTETPVETVPLVAVPSVPAEEQIDIEYFSKVKLRVALVEAAENVPKSKKLLKLQVNLGETFGKRQVLAGIAQHYTPETIVGKRIVIVANLKPATLMGLESQGMLLAGSDDAVTMILPLEPSSQLPLGSIVR